MKNETLTLLFGGIIGLLVIIGVIYLLWQPNQPETIEDLYQMIETGQINDPDIGYSHNGFVFIKRADGTWYTQVLINDTIVPLTFRYGPRDVIDIPISGNTNESFNKQPLFITIDPNSNQQKYIGLAATDIGSHLYQALKITAYSACIVDSPDCGGRPVITCTNTNAPVIYVKANNETSANIELKGNCVVIEGNELEIVKAADKFLMIWYQIL